MDQQTKPQEQPQTSATRTAPAKDKPKKKREWKTAPIPSRDMTPNEIIAAGRSQSTESLPLDDDEGEAQTKEPGAAGPGKENTKDNPRAEGH